MNKQMKCSEVAKNIIINYLSKSVSPEAVVEIFEINLGNKEILLAHIKALKSIFEDAIKELEEE